MILKFKKIITFIILNFIFINLFNYKLAYSLPSNENYTMLIIASYDSENSWESSLIQGFKEYLDPLYNIKIEYLDSKTLHSDIYTDSFLNLLNLKYKGDDIRYILTLDDEALMLVKNNIFNEDSFIYNTPTIFIGANNVSSLTLEESKYITGIYEIQDNLEILNLILNSNKNIENILILLDDNTYSFVTLNNIKSVQYLTNRNVNIEFIQSKYYEDIVSKLEDSNSSNSAILLVGNYYSHANNKFINSKELINLIQSKTSTPIYSKLEPYINYGAIGGIINDGYRLGSVASNLIGTITLEPNLYIPPASYNTYDKILFNFNAIRYYDINPSLLPKDAIYLNKGYFDFLVSKELQMVIHITLIISVIAIIGIIVMAIFHRRNANIHRELLKESIKLDEIRTNFIITISHELRTPLNIIINSAKLLNINIDNMELDPPKIKKQLSYIIKNSNRLLKLISNLIDVTKIQYGYVDAHFEMANVVYIIEETALSVVELAKKHNIDIIFDTDEEEIYSAIDIGKIERIVLNLLSNSIKFIKDKGEIHITIHKNDNSLTIYFKDNGIGIPDNMLPNIFNKFYQVKSSLNRENEGSGLGLYIVKGLVDLHKGNISVESKLGIGSTFKIELPIVILENKTSDINYASSLDNLIEIELSDIQK